MIADDFDAINSLLKSLRPERTPIVCPECEGKGYYIMEGDTPELVTCPHCQNPEHKEFPCP